jgi:hypothetical protein
MKRRLIGILAWFGILAATMGGLTWWLGVCGPALVPITNSILITCGITPDGMLRFARKVGAIHWWEGPTEE